MLHLQSFIYYINIAAGGLTGYKTKKSGYIPEFFVLYVEVTNYFINSIF
jgi:hypothetical protein